ncbi:hypothetical protein K438DRAFT_711513 [Mycena galopus ATCC 62051]|nr:hypothetical protein K438DRAFT_711513 [Mycena galopus ATCC 62051]
MFSTALTSLRPSLNTLAPPNLLLTFAPEVPLPRTHRNSLLRSATRTRTRTLPVLTLPLLRCPCFLVLARSSPSPAHLTSFHSLCFAHFARPLLLCKVSRRGPWWSPREFAHTVLLVEIGGEGAGGSNPPDDMRRWQSASFFSISIHSRGAFAIHSLTAPATCDRYVFSSAYSGRIPLRLRALSSSGQLTFKHQVDSSTPSPTAQPIYRSIPSRRRPWWLFASLSNFIRFICSMPLILAPLYELS